MSSQEQREEEAGGGRAAAELEPEQGAERNRGGKGEQAPSVVSAEAAWGEPGCAARGAVPRRSGEEGVLRAVQPWRDSPAAGMAHLQCHLGYCSEKQIHIWVTAQTDPHLGYCSEKRIHVAAGRPPGRQKSQAGAWRGEAAPCLLVEGTNWY